VKNKKKSPSYGYGTDKRDSPMKNGDWPSANSYNPNMTFTQKGSQKWGFGSEKRAEMG